jgi:hypothetical protein
VPDGRIIAVGGEGSPGNEPPESLIEAFSPPYLFKGIRPEIRNLTIHEFKRKGTIEFDIAKTNALTGVVLMSNPVLTHFMNSGNNRFLNLEFEQNGNQIKAFLPDDSLRLMPGWYMLFAMVDDIPSVAQIVKVEKGVSIVTNTEVVLNNEFAFDVYPNPASDQLFIKVANSIAQGELTIEVFDGIGRKIYNQRIQSQLSLSSHEINLPISISPGIFYIKLSTQGESKIQKIIISK